VAFYQWYCAVAADLTFQPPASWPPTRIIFNGYRNSHLRFDEVDELIEIDCLAAVFLMEGDVLRPGDSAPVQIRLAIPMVAGRWMERVPQAGAHFVLLHTGERIAAGSVTHVLEPLVPITTTSH
jgi:hypothetical protein